MVIILGKYTKPPEVIDTLLADHRKFLDRYYEQSKFICSGPQDPRVGGVIIANVESVDEAGQIIKDDPFHINGAAEYQFIKFLPLKCDERFSCFIK
ncbi:MAG: YciI family protein [Syntrophales bacterium]